MNRYLITGGAGFIGANLVKTLLKQNPQSLIHVLVQPQTNRWRLTDIEHKIMITEVDLIDFPAITKLISTIKPTHIFHLAAFGGMPDETYQTLIFKVNFEATVNLINACKQVGFACFINTGSSSEYGKKSVRMNEQDVLEPLSDYGVAKTASTKFCLKEARVNNLPIYTIRPFSVYGPYELKTRLIPTIIYSALKNIPLQLSTPTNVRDFIHVDDVVKLYLSLAQIQPYDTFIFNAGSGTESSIQEVVNTVEKIIHRQLKPTWGTVQTRPWEPSHWQADISSALNVVQWKPQHNLESGLTATIEWFKENLYLYKEV